MARFMLDTNICIYLMKNQPSVVANRRASSYKTGWRTCPNNAYNAASISSCGRRARRRTSVK